MGRPQRLGRWGEDLACAFLLDHGYEILARNVETPYGEIDVVARKEDFTAFVEVKSRASQSLGPPEISVTPRKRQHMLTSAAHYAQAHDIAHWQIDVIAVQKLDTRTEITHFENALARSDDR